MIRVLLYLVLVALIALGVVWIADRPGDVAVTWQGWRIETSVMVAVVALGIVVALAILLWSIVRTILRSPDLIAMFLSHRRGVRGYLAISRGLVAVGSGDVRAAQRAAEEAERIAPGEPLALLLNAQAAQLAGNRAAAELAFRAMTERPDTKLLGLRGLFVEAQRRNDMAAARAFADEAAKASPSLAWAGQAALEFRVASGDWAGALAALDRNSRYRLVDRTAYRRQRAVLLTARALAAEAEDGSRDTARSLAIDAVKLDPSLVPAAELAGRLLGEAGELRRASRIVERAWQANPHPDLADTYAHLRSGDSARERLARVQTLAQKAPSHAESALAVARAAIDAQEFVAARNALKPLLKEPTQRVAALMAEIEERESGDEGRAREWMARALRAPRDPAWTADGIVSDRWLPATPDGRLDRFQWRVPLAELAAPSDAIEAVEAEAEEVVVPAVALPPSAAAAASAAAPVLTAPAEPAPARASAPPRAAPPKRVDAVIPLMHVPDDPGPEPAPDREPQPEPSEGSRGLGLFK
ncbi:MAG: heme biosynthesis protein HemY [Alphaproteobacteria bacterium]|nr:heme biosynthesis protein HemY [Alphaproteobacteria bacterium]